MKKILATVFMLLLCAVVFCACGKTTEKSDENYEIGQDRIPSLTFVLGERKIKSSKTEKDGTICITYETEEEGYMDVYEYMSYLIDNCGGVVTEALNEGEEGKCAIAVESEENGYVMTVEFDYKSDEYEVVVKRVAGKINKEE